MWTRCEFRRLPCILETYSDSPYFVGAHSLTAPGVPKRHEEGGSQLGAYLTPQIS